MKLKNVFLMLHIIYGTQLFAQKGRITYKVYNGLISTLVKLPDSLKSKSNLKLTIRGNGHLVFVGTKYEIKLDSTAKYGDSLLLKIALLKGKKVTLLEQRIYIVSYAPKPNPKLGYLPFDWSPSVGGTIKNAYSKEQILYADSLRVDFNDREFPYNNIYKVIGYKFTVLAKTKGKMTDIVVIGNRLTTAIIETIKILNSGDTILFDSIKVKLTIGGMEASLPPLIFNIK